MNRLLVAVFLLGVLSGCASNQPAAEDSDSPYAAYVTEHQLPKLDRVSNFRLRDWSLLDDRYLILTTSRRDAYLIELRADCRDLKFANAISVDQTSRSTLDASFDSIRIPRQTGPTCYIEVIYQLTDEQADEVKDLES